ACTRRLRVELVASGPAETQRSPGPSMIVSSHVCPPCAWQFIAKQPICDRGRDERDDAKQQQRIRESQRECRLEQQASKPEPAKQRERHDCDGLSAATAKIGGNRRKLGMRQVEAERKQNDRNANTGQRQWDSQQYGTDASEGNAW